VILMKASGFQIENLIVTAVSVALLMSRKVPAPLIVVAAILGGMFV
jgi:chromate transporter